MSAPRIGFVGFGEAAAAIAAGLVEEGARGIVACDPQPRPEVPGVEMLDGIAAVCGRADVVISAVTSAVALSVAEQVAPHLEARHLYVDINSVSPDTKKRIGQAVAGSGARFVEAAVMAAVPPKRHKVPILLAGPAAGELIALLAPFGMNLSDAGPELGRAAATKMFRSVVVKGLEALLQECVLGAARYNAADDVLQSLEDGYPGMDWKHMADYLIGRTAIHGDRRAHEMDEVAETLRGLDIEPLMSEAAAKRIRWLAAKGLKEKFGDQAPADFHAVLRAAGEE